MKEKVNTELSGEKDILVFLRILGAWGAIPAQLLLWSSEARSNLSVCPWDTGLWLAACSMPWEWQGRQECKLHRAAWVASKLLLDASKKQLIFDKPWTLSCLHCLSLGGAVKWAVLKTHPTSLGHDLQFSKAFPVVIQRICFYEYVLHFVCMHTCDVCVHKCCVNRKEKKKVLLPWTVSKLLCIKLNYWYFRIFLELYSQGIRLRPKGDVYHDWRWQDETELSWEYL